MSRVARDFEMLERIRHKVEALAEQLAEDAPGIDDIIINDVLDILQDEYVRLAEIQAARRSLIGLRALP